MHQFDRLSESERDYWIAEWETGRERCPDCGNPATECSDPERKWYPYRRICYASMAREAAGAMYAALHETTPYHDGTFTSWVKERSGSHPFSGLAGVTVNVATYDVTPDDDFTTDPEASPTGLAAQESPGDQGEATEQPDGAEQKAEQI